jgi:hypothetical protein
VYADAAITGHADTVGGLTPGLIDVDPSPELLRGVFVAGDGGGGGEDEDARGPGASAPRARPSFRTASRC